jgi:hypothetical protein
VRCHSTERRSATSRKMLSKSERVTGAVSEATSGLRAVCADGKMKPTATVSGAMSNKKESRAYVGSTVDVRVPFRYTIVHGSDPSLRSVEQKGATTSLNLSGLSFETDSMDQGGFHLSFTESTFGRNSLEIKLDLGKKLGEIEVLGQVEWYERRLTAMGHSFIVGVSFVDIQADELAVLREFLRQAQSFSQ